MGEKAGEKKLLCNEGTNSVAEKKNNTKPLSSHFHPLDKRCHWQKHYLLFDCDNVLSLMFKLETISCSNETRIYPVAVFFFFFFFPFIKQSSDVFAAGAAVTKSQRKPCYDNVTRRNPQCENNVISRNIGDILFSTCGVVALQQFDLVMATRFIKRSAKPQGKSF